MTTILRPLRLAAALLLLALVTASCQDTYEDMFLDPERATDARIKYLFTQALLDTNFPMDYWEGWYQIYGDLSQWIQITGTENDESMMDVNSPRWADLWTAYYTQQAMRVQEMQRIYAELPEEERAQNEVYLVLGKILNAYNTALITDLWGAIPYAEAFQARAPSAEERNIFPGYDTQETVYYAVLDSLQEAAAALERSDLAEPTDLATQDIFLHGDLMQWQRFANTLRLRLGMRLSEVAPEKAQQVVSEVLTGGHPLVETNEENIVWQMTSEYDAWGARGRAVRERTDATYAPEVMMNLMNEAGDPRIPVFFDPSYEGEYVGLPSSPAEQPADISRERFAYVDSLMFAQNPTFPGFVITAAEVSFLKAEAYLRGWTPGDPAAAYAQGLRQSVEMYYDTYNMNPNAPTMPPPGQAAVEAFVTGSSAAFDGSLRSIAVQKWIHFNHTQPYQAWASIRRTGYPELPPDRLPGGRVLERTVRITYPSSELTNNRQNYQEVQGQDTRTTHIWWDVE